MTLVHRVDFPQPISTLADYVRHRGGRGLEAASSMTPDDIIAVVLASGLRGRGGAGFPTGRKWRTVADMHSDEEATCVIVNAAEGEPGTFKDRHLLRTDPYHVIEGALIAARAVQGSEIIFALKKVNTIEHEILEGAIAEVIDAGWANGLSIRVATGPDEYLFGEESALLEVIDGRNPFPRIAPPYRRGVSEETSSSGLSARVKMAGPGGGAPALANNVETFANVAHIVARGAEWFRTSGTSQSTGTFVCTITGSTTREGVGEIRCGTPLTDVIAAIGGGMPEGRTIKAVLCGVSNRVITPELLDSNVDYETMQPLQVGPGSGGFIVFDDTIDMVAVAAGVARFLAIESCGQCSPCKLDGLELATKLTALCHNQASARDLERIMGRLDTITTGARCSLASQQTITVGSILQAFPADVAAHLDGTAVPVEPFLIAELRDVANGVASWDDRHASKQPDWSYDATWSGKTPADLYTEHSGPNHLAD